MTERLAEIIPFPRRADHVETRGDTMTCECGQPATHIVYPHVDHRRRKPWPKAYGVCPRHAIGKDSEAKS